MKLKLFSLIIFLALLILSSEVLADSPKVNIFVDKSEIQFKGKINITWSAHDTDLDTVKMEVFNPMGKTAFTTELHEGNPGWTGRNYILDAYVLHFGGNYTARVWANDTEGNVAQMKINFYIIPWKNRDLIPPKVSVTMSNKTIAWNGTINLNWSAADNNPTDGLQKAWLRLYNPKYQLIYEKNISSGNVTFKATDLYYAGMYTIKLIAWDNANNKNFTEVNFGIEPWALRNK